MSDTVWVLLEFYYVNSETSVKSIVSVHTTAKGAESAKIEFEKPLRATYPDFGTIRRCAIVEKWRVQQ